MKTRKMAMKRTDLHLNKTDPKGEQDQKVYPHRRNDTFNIEFDGIIQGEGVLK